MFIEEQSKEIKQLNEMFVHVGDSLPSKIENSIFYPKLKVLLHQEILRFFMRSSETAHRELKDDLNLLRLNVGEKLSETEIREYLDSLKEKYNSVDNNLGLDYHIEVTRFDYGVAIWVVIKRADIHMKKFIFRFRKTTATMGLNDVNIGGIPLEEGKDARKERYLKLMGDKDES
jgi:hypothetical protein